MSRKAAELPNLFRAEAFICSISDYGYLFPERDLERSNRSVHGITIALVLISYDVNL